MLISFNSFHPVSTIILARNGTCTMLLDVTVKVAQVSYPCLQLQHCLNFLNFNTRFEILTEFR